jgi:small subunit ribosomal protein S1
VLKVGDEIDVYVLNVDQDRQRIGLSLKRLQPEPWTRVEGKYTVDQVVQGRVTKLATFGAFVRIDEEIEGLIHVSELAERHVSHPKEILEEGDEVTVRIIRIDPERKRIGLSLKGIEDEADVDWQPADEAEEEGYDLSDEPEEADTESMSEPEAEEPASGIPAEE